MHPRLLTLPQFELAGRSLGPITLHTYGFLLAIAFLAGLWVASRQARRTAPLLFSDAKARDAYDRGREAFDRTRKDVEETVSEAGSDVLSSGVYPRA